MGKSSRDSKRRDRSGSARRNRPQHSDSSDNDSYGRGRSRSRTKSRDRNRSWSKSRGRHHSRSPSSRGGSGRGRSDSRGDHRRNNSRERDGSKDSRSKHDKRNSKRHLKEKSRTSEERTKGVVKGIETIKSRMRSALNAAETDIAGAKEGKGTTNENSTVMGLTVTEAVARHRDIQRIEEEEGFHQSTFVSSAGGAGGRVKKEDVTDRAAMILKKQDAHDKAMFGPKWQNEEKYCDDERNETIVENELPKEIPLANSRFSEDPAVRESRWLRIYRERRAKLLCVQHDGNSASPVCI